MPVALLVLIAFEGVRYGSRQYHKMKAKKYNYEGVFKRDSLGRPVDATTGRRLSRNEARAIAEHRRSTAREAELEKNWQAKGNTLPEYSQASVKSARYAVTATTTVSSSHSDPSLHQDGQQHIDEQHWQDWSISGAPCYTEQDEVAGNSHLIRAQ